MNPKQLKRLTRMLTIAFFISGGLTVIATFFYFSQVTVVKANTPDINSTRARYPSMVGSRIDSCSLCHTGSIPQLNPYGAAYKASGRVPAALTAIEGQDSDGDGYTNLQEISALFFPGDPNDHPVVVPTATRIPPTPTTVPPTATSVPPTATAGQPTATAVQPTATAVQPTETQVVPTNPPPQPTEPPVIQPTATQVTPPTQTPQPTVEDDPAPQPTLQCRTDKDDKEYKEKKDKGKLGRGDDDKKRLPKCKPGDDHDHDDDDDDKEHSQVDNQAYPLSFFLGSLIQGIGF